MFATGIARELFANDDLVLAPIVADELLYVYEDDAKQLRRVIDSALYRENGLSATVATMSTVEQERFVSYAGSVDDGEAQSLAIAKERGLLIVTDDVAGIKLAMRERIELQTTLGLVRRWSTGKALADVRAVLGRIEQRGRYRPPAEHTDYTWYVGVMSE